MGSSSQFTITRAIKSCWRQHCLLEFLDVNNYKPISRMYSWQREENRFEVQLIRKLRFPYQCRVIFDSVRATRTSDGASSPLTGFGLCVPSAISSLDCVMQRSC